MESVSNRIGKIAENFIYDYLDNKGKDVYVCRFVDTYDANKGRWGDPSQKKVLIRRRPCDFMLVTNGVTYFCEVKATTNSKGLTSSLFSQQVAERTRIQAAGGLYIYFIYSVEKKKWYWVTSTTLKTNATWEALETFSIDFPPVPL